MYPHGGLAAEQDRGIGDDPEGGGGFPSFPFGDFVRQQVGAGFTLGVRQFFACAWRLTTM